MKNSQRNSQKHVSCSGSAKWILLASVAAVLALIIFVILQSRPSKMIAKKQYDLIVGIEKRLQEFGERVVDARPGLWWRVVGALQTKD